MTQGKQKQEEQKRVVVIGGGTGLATILRGLKEVVDIDLTAIVTVADDGGSSGILREEMKMPPPGDIRNVLVALAEREPLLESLLQHRFKNGNGLAGHSLGNLLIAGMQEITGDFVTAVKALSRVLAVRGRVLPAANQSIHLQARMKDGTIVCGESNIPKVNKKIEKISLQPADIEALPEAVTAIEEADLILVGPGSLYTSVIPNLLVQGIQEALKASSADKIYITNVMTQPGETDGYDVKDHIEAIYDHIQFPLFQKVIVNIGEIPASIQQKYQEEGAIPVTYSKGSLEPYGIEVIEEQLFLMDDYLRHDAKKVTQIVYRCIGGKIEN
jgi:uncharacterized cofD-like protein